MNQNQSISESIPKQNTQYDTELHAEQDTK